MRILLILAWLLIPASGVFAAWTEFESGERQTALIEMFSSEGCSSCPPAEAWASALLDSPQLWSSFIPVIFHVDYWDYLGWKDPFADSRYTQRQRRYVHSWKQSTLYTPGLVLNGKPWEGWRRSRSIPQSQERPGVLRVKQTADETYEAFFFPAGAFKGGQIHAAFLGFGIDVAVKRGENAGRTLRHDFTVLEFQSRPLQGEPLTAEFRRQSKTIQAPRLGLAVWVTEGSDLRPVQAAGGYLAE